MAVKFPMTFVAMVSHEGRLLALTNDGDIWQWDGMYWMLLTKGPTL